MNALRTYIWIIVPASGLIPNMAAKETLNLLLHDELLSILHLVCRLF
jgi:hypothetical protein